MDDLIAGRRRDTTVMEDAVTALLGLLVVAALHADGRAHILGLPDSFFSPWHAFLYGGLGLMIVWLAILSRLVARRSSAPVAVMPAGYLAAAVGAVLFGVGGVADMIWHTIFGIEFGIDALLSPSHLLLFVGGGMLLSGPLLAQLRRGGPIRSGIPALLAVVGITGVVAFALSYLSAFLTDAPAIPITREPEGTEAHFAAEGIASAGLGSFLVTSLVLAVPAVFLLRRRLWFPGALTVLVTAIAVLASSLVGFQNLETVVAAFLSGTVLDLLVGASLRARPAPRIVESAVAAGLPLVVWSGQLIARSIREPLGWSEEMTVGVVLLSSILSLFAVLVLGGPPRTRPDGTSGEDHAAEAPTRTARSDG